LHQTLVEILNVGVADRPEQRVSTINETSINTALPEVKQLYIVITAVLLCHQRDKVPQRVDSALTLLVGLQEEHPAC